MRVLAPLLSLPLLFHMAPAPAVHMSPAPAVAAPSFAEPALSPDHREIAFVSGGDIWTVPAAGGEARLLVSDPAQESRPLYSPDGSRLAFVSTRTGNGDIYVLALNSGALTRITFDDQLDQLDGWSPDGRWLYFSSTSHDIAGMNDVYRVRADGGTPMPVSADRYANEYWAAPSPTDAGTLAITARGIVSSQWWRKGHSHLDESEIWLVHDVAVGSAATPRYEAVTDGGAKDAWPMWSPDGRTLYWISDRSGAPNVWSRAAAGGAATQLTDFRDGRVLWPSIAADGSGIVFERDFKIFALDLATRRVREVPITLRGASAATPPTHLVLTNRFQSLALSPDGKKVAFIAHGEVFAASARDGGDATRVTATPAKEGQLAWAPDSRRLVYASDRDGAWHLFSYDFTSGRETQLTRGAESDVSPRFSPDGRQVAFVRGGRELRLLDVATGADRRLATGFLGRVPFVSSGDFTFSPDGRWIAYLDTRAREFQNAFVVPTACAANEACEPRQVSFLANVGGSSLSWSPDGTFLLFATGQRTEPTQIARVDLRARLPRFREDQFRELFRDNTAPHPNMPSPAPAPGRPVSAPRDTTPPDSARAARPTRTVIAFDDIRQRLTFLPVGLDVGDVSISPDGKTALFTAEAAGQENLYVYSLDELSRETPVARQLTSTPGTKNDAQFSPDGKEVFYLENGRINVVPVESRQPRSLAVTAEMDVDFAREKDEVFAEAWSMLRDNFYDAGMHGVDWNAVRAEYAPQVEGARTTDELRRILALMVGELNASHSGVGGPTASPQVVTGRLGLAFDRAEYESHGRLRVASLVPLGPAALAGGIGAGDYLLAVDGHHLDARTNLDSLMAYEIGRRVALTVARAADGSGSRDVIVRPVPTSTEKGLLYRDWVESRRAYVAMISGGRLGYVHLIDMGAPSLQQLYVDLDVENRARDGVIVDVRNNNGGFINAYAIDVLARRPYLTMTFRGGQPAPARSVLGQRALELPTALVTNQHSLSDAEDFTEGYRALGLGPVVGEPTAGWIIYTTNVPLLDGSTLRIPFIRVQDHEGRDMELHPRAVDVAVKRPIGESYTGRDSQLEAAVRVLLARIASHAAPAGGSGGR